ncbi:helix-turn-helix domain-containing protein [Paenibacillus gorillae]|uniref:helix-turn-helix domain-containing protein n=1 Tax=Paenibacillus gorillae TaxID=1243662 RepID=UPI0005A8CF51|nr:helix-turn-helix transcriptional regulator [Paenibacillus gorillae]
MSTLGERIRGIRKNNQLNQIEFANMIGVSQGTLSELEQDKYKPSVDILIVIQDKFKVGLEWLIIGSAEDTYSINLNEKENKLFSGFRKLNNEDQHEIIEIIGIKLKRHRS